MTHLTHVPTSPASGAGEFGFGQGRSGATGPSRQVGQVGWGEWASGAVLGQGRSGVPLGASGPPMPRLFQVTLPKL